MTSDLVTQCPLRKISNDIPKKIHKFNRIVSENGSTEYQFSEKQQTKSCAVDINFWCKTCTGYYMYLKLLDVKFSIMISFKVPVHVLITSATTLI